jgi:hypothetical protein
MIVLMMDLVRSSCLRLMLITLMTGLPNSRCLWGQVHRCIADKCPCLLKPRIQPPPDLLMLLQFKALSLMVLLRSLVVTCIRPLRILMVPRGSTMTLCCFLIVWPHRRKTRSIKWRRTLCPSISTV